MASLMPITRRPAEITTVISRACAAARTLPSATASRRQFGTSTQSQSCIARGQSPLNNKTKPIPAQCSYAARLPKTTIRRISEQSATPAFKQWVFNDINALLPTTEGSSPPSSPQKSLILVDVREPAEMKGTGVIPSAVAVPLASQGDALFLTPEEFETRFGYPKPGAGAGDKGRDIVFYCKAGVRARAAAQMALQAGYDAERIGVYEGSWLDWAGNGGRVERWDGEGYE
ncbi:Rhodanese-like domain-containing protein [Aspergillus stella-maris]|uniref:Rhodanese-like domain-containing protein n=1 Tax=Aspergillus stella-maris TaxID=1810926 RepID=UPI003CCD9576